MSEASAVTVFGAGDLQSLVSQLNMWTPQIELTLQELRGAQLVMSGQMPMLKSGRGLHGILRHHKHGDNHNNLSDVPAVFNTMKNTSSGRLVATTQIRWCRFVFDQFRIDNRRVTIRTEGVHRNTLSHALC